MTYETIQQDEIAEISLNWIMSYNRTYNHEKKEKDMKTKSDYMYLEITKCRNVGIN